MDYLISKGKAREMIVAMPDGQVGAFGALIRAPPAERRRLAELHEDYFLQGGYAIRRVEIPSLKEYKDYSRSLYGWYADLGDRDGSPRDLRCAGIFSSGASDQARERIPSIKDRLNGLKLLYVSCGNWDTLVEERNRALCSHSMNMEYAMSTCRPTQVMYQPSGKIPSRLCEPPIPNPMTD